MRVLGLLLLAMIVALPAAATMPEDEYVFILRARSNPYWQAMVDGINDAAKANGIKASIYQTQTDVAAEEQLNICMTAVARQPVVLAISAITVSVGLQCMKAAVEKGIIVADMDAGLLPDEATKAGFVLSYTVGSDNYVIGQEAARYLKSISRKPDPKVLVLEGAPASTQGTKRAKGFKDELAKVMPGAVIKASISGEWDRLKAMNITTDTLQREPELDVVYAANDLMALGATEAAKTAGKQLTIIGVDGTADARKAVLAGRLAATVAQLPYLIGKRSVEKAVQAAAGEHVIQTEITPTPVLDKKTLSENKADFMQYVR